MSIPPKKSLGQNFLRSEKALGQIIDAADLHKDDVVLEVGPGEGVLTERLLEKAGKVIAVEKDDRLIEVLSQKFSNEIGKGIFKLVHADILEFDPSSYKLEAINYKLIANIPYYITGALIRRFLSETIQPSRMVLLLQKEVAQRIVTRDGKESMLSISVKAYGTPIYIGTVKAGSFHPMPNVDSAILLIENISKENFTDIDEGHFFQIVSLGFAHKRKMLAGNLKESFSPETISNAFKKLDLDPKCRAEDISIETWCKLSELLQT